QSCVQRIIPPDPGSSLAAPLAERVPPRVHQNKTGAATRRSWSGVENENRISGRKSPSPRTLLRKVGSIPTIYLHERRRLARRQNLRTVTSQFREIRHVNDIRPFARI